MHHFHPLFHTNRFGLNQYLTWDPRRPSGWWRRACGVEYDYLEATYDHNIHRYCSMDQYVQIFHMIKSGKKSVDYLPGNRPQRWRTILPDIADASEVWGRNAWFERFWNARMAAQSPVT